MRILTVAMVVAGATLAGSATAQAKGGHAFEGFGRHGGGGHSAPSRAASFGSSAPRSAPRAPSFNPGPRTPSRAASIGNRSGGPSFTRPSRGGSVDAAPRPSSRGSNGGGGLFRRQDVPAGGQGNRAAAPTGRTRGRAGSGEAAPRAASIGGDNPFDRPGNRASGRDNVPGFSHRGDGWSGGHGSDGHGNDGHGNGNSHGDSGNHHFPGPGPGVPQGGPFGNHSGGNWHPGAGYGPGPGSHVGYRDGFRNGYRVGYRDGRHDGHGWGYHDYYDRNRWFLSFSFGVGTGPYFGVSYYHPFHSWTLGLDYAFFYPEPVSYGYVPYGFYSAYQPVYVTRYTTVVRETVPVVEYETRTTSTVEEIDTKSAKGDVDAPDGNDDAAVAVAEPKPAAGSPATEKLLREASGMFQKKEYYDAAVKFRLAAISSPDLPGPRFALGQALIALGQDAYAARVLRKAVLTDPTLLDETADLVGVYESQEEFDRVMKALEERAAAAPADGDARFLLGYQKYFTGDPRSREIFDGLHEVAPKDEASDLFRGAIEKRFKVAADLPPIGK